MICYYFEVLCSSNSWSSSINAWISTTYCWFQVDSSSTCDFSFQWCWRTLSFGILLFLSWTIYAACVCVRTRIYLTWYLAYICCLLFCWCKILGISWLREDTQMEQYNWGVYWYRSIWNWGSWYVSCKAASFFYQIMNC